MTRISKLILMIALLLICVLAHPSASWAIAESPIPPPVSSSIDANTIPSEKLNQFVQSCLEVVTLIERREGELQAAETESESARIQRDIEAEAIAIIERNGLTRQEYLQLLSLANVDPEFGERVATLLQETPS
ncbi:DUF4168 domain-containing protein [Cyanobacteria bacterium FACHB-DQ100]|uniref:DUF4168 domain-containing protein n=1 Tax=unclassified Leptolyngbya TaxID=2650499 RepID=UPI00167FE518|nr:DUF4168 domain-containing protein [Leptolyngbya sp. FACHB-17]MBD1825462.1 DUF4168 domain-containing protein [Cyanobacteria bacterium FACHB-DQ100]MBD2079311.1 DUF4168 domain-containing protein [Leptolyngbya sp. FACHB-17]